MAIQMAALVAGTRRRQPIGDPADITAPNDDSSIAMYHAFRVAHANLLPGEQLEAEVYTDGEFVGRWVVFPFDERRPPLPPSMVTVIRQLREGVYA